MLPTAHFPETFQLVDRQQIVRIETREFSTRNATDEKHTLPINLSAFSEQKALAASFHITLSTRHIFKVRNTRNERISSFQRIETSDSTNLFIIQ